MACAQNPRTYLGAKYRRIAARRGPQKANVAIQHSMLTAIWHMGTTGTLYDDPGADYFTRLHPDRAKNRAIHQLEAWATTSPSTTPHRQSSPDARESSRQRLETEELACRPGSVLARLVAVGCCQMRRLTCGNVTWCVGLRWQFLNVLGARGD